MHQTAAETPSDTSVVQHEMSVATGKPSVPPYGWVLIELYNAAAVEPLGPCGRSTIVWPIVGQRQDDSDAVGRSLGNHAIQALQDQQCGHAQQFFG